MADIRVFASDYDGTLARWPWPPTARDRIAIGRFQDEGGLFGLCTGRTLGRLPRALGRIRIDFYVLATGALVLDGDRTVVEERRIPEDVVRELLALPVVALRAVTAERSWVVSKVAKVVRGGLSFSAIERLADIDEPLYGMGFALVGPSAARKFAAQVNERFGRVVSAYQNAFSVDVVPRGCSKGTGLAVVRRELGAGSLGGIGDSYNDLAMLEEVDVGYTFPTAPAPVRAAATRVVPSVADALADFSRR